MSYSRFSNSFWYTYHTIYSEPLNLHNQIFVICTITSFSWYELVHRRRECLSLVKEMCSEIYKPECQPSNDEMKELEGYMVEFIVEMFLNFVKMELFISDISKKIKKLRKESNHSGITINLNSVDAAQLDWIIDDTLNLVGGPYAVPTY